MTRDQERCLWSTVLMAYGAEKLGLIGLKAFIEASALRALKPVVIFHAKAFEKFSFQDFRLKHPRRSDNSWIFFFSHAFTGHKRTASLWLDIEAGKAPHFGLKSGIYNLTYSADCHGAITVNPVPRHKTTTNHDGSVSGSPSDEG